MVGLVGGREDGWMGWVGGRLGGRVVEVNECDAIY